MHNGNRIPPDKDKAAEYFRMAAPLFKKAADEGNINAIFYITVMEFQSTK